MHLPNLNTMTIIANHLRLRRLGKRVLHPPAVIVFIVLFGAVVTLLGLHPRLVELRDNSPYYLLGTVHPYMLLVLEASLAVLFLLSAIVVVAYHSRNPAAVWMALIFALSGIVLPGMSDALINVQFSTLADWFRLPVLTTRTLTMVVALLMLYIFPDGQFVPRWTRWLFAVWVVMNVLWLLIPTLPFNPSYGGTWRETLVASYMFHIAYFMSGMGAQWYRYRHTTDDQQRRQLRWGLAGLLIAALGTVTYFGVLVWGQDNFPYTPTTALEFLYGRMAAQLVLMGILPVYCLFVAITNDRVWQVESIFSRALLYSALSFSVIALYVILVSVLSSLFHVESGYLVTSLLATGAVALVFDAIRERIQRVIKRSMFGRRDDLSGVLDALGKQIEVAASPDSVLHAVVQTIGKELRLPYVAVELHATSVSKRQTAPLGIVSFGVPTTPNHRERFPLIVQGKTVGVLIIALRDGQPGLAPADMDVLHALATQIGSLVQALQLTADLQESRQRLVAAREEERRRLRRDLHDSVGPMLAALSMQTETARELIATQPQRSEALLGDVLLQLQAILGDIRRVVYGLRPPALDDLGLASALRTQSAMFGQGKVVLRVMIEEPLPPLSAATEVAIYRIVQEALTNVMRHADARNAEVRMSIDTAQSLVVLEITDDGKGIAADSRSGVGLHSMHERAAELNGTCTIHSTLGEGTKIKVVLPW